MDFKIGKKNIEVSFSSVTSKQLSKSQIEEYKEKYNEWKKLINMTTKELKDFMSTEEGKNAGLSRTETKNAGANGKKIRSGRDSARAIIRMKQKPFEKWNTDDIEWMLAQISFVKRMSGNEGPLFKNDKMTRKMTSLLIWGHDPRK